MKEAWFSIAGVSFDFISHGVAAEYLFDELQGLLTGFLISKKKAADAVCLVHLWKKWSAVSVIITRRNVEYFLRPLICCLLEL
jgi:extradiol dioxygenase family protein